MIYSNLNAVNELPTYPSPVCQALAFLRSHDVTQLPRGKHQIMGEQMFAVVSDLKTAPLEIIPAEVHRRYIDVQYWPMGGEVFGIAPRIGTEPILESHEENDTWYLDPEHENHIAVRAGDFAIFFPWDIHRPGGMTEHPQTIRKCVIKVDMAMLLTEG